MTGEQLQLRLIEPRPPIARRRDPSTSHQAAAEVTASGHRDRQLRLVAHLVNRYPGHTSAELAQIAGLEGLDLDRYDVARRTAELAPDPDKHPDQAERARFKRGDKRRCRCTEKMALTWWPA